MGTFPQEHLDEIARCAAMFADEAAAREPYLRLFRVSPDEVAARSRDSESLTALTGDISSDPTLVRLSAFAEGVAQCGREEVRFQRWLDWNVRGVRSVIE